MGSILGNRVTRVEDPRFLTARRRLRRRHPISRTRRGAPTSARRTPTPRSSRSTSATRVEVPGVLRVFTAADLAPLNPTPPSRPGLPEAMNRPFLAADRVRFVGEAVVAVVAETQAAAVDAAELVLVDYEPLPAVVDVEQSATDELLIFPEAGIERRDEARHARAGRLLRVRGGRRRADRQPASERRADGGARRRRVLDARRPVSCTTRRARAVTSPSRCCARCTGSNRHRCA